MQPSRDTDPEEDEDYENDLEVDEDDESWVNFNQKFQFLTSQWSQSLYVNLDKVISSSVMSVRLWNFKDGGF